MYIYTYIYIIYEVIIYFQRLKLNHIVVKPENKYGNTTKMHKMMKTVFSYLCAEKQGFLKLIK